MKYHIITYGCQMNVSDSERISAVLEKIGYKKTPFISEADLIVVNMCSVRQSAVDRIYGLIPKLKKNPKTKTILTGCILKKDKIKLSQYFDYILNIKNLPKWFKSFKKEKKSLCQNSRDRGNFGTQKFESNYLRVQAKHSNKFSAFVAIMNGCNNFCSYCVVPYTRGREISKPVDEIICEIKNLVKKGYKEIILLGQNVNSYSSKKTNFPSLLRSINKIPGDFKIRFLTNHPKDMTDELIEVIARSKKIIKEIHLPIQSANNELLKKMNRNYRVEDYKKLIKKIQHKIPEIKISTDVIVGFPGETKKQFQDTADFFKKNKFQIAYIAKYSPRPGTSAFKIKDDVSIQEKKRRYNILNKIINS